MESTQGLSQRIEAALSSLGEERKRLQEMETRQYQEWKQRLEKLVALFVISDQTRREFEREAAEGEVVRLPGSLRLRRVGRAN